MVEGRPRFLMRDAPRRSQNRVLVLAALLVALHVALAWVSRSPGISWGEDDATYVLLGREILHGQYAERWDVEAPVHTRYPPGFPALLSVGNALFGDHVAIYTMLVLLASAASIALFFVVLRRHFGDDVALFVTGLTAINAMAVADAGLVMAEAPFRFWATLTLWSASRENPRPGHLALAGTSAVIAALTRSVGVAIIAALAFHWLLERRWKSLALLIVGTIPVGLWFYWTLIAPDPNQREPYLYQVLTATEQQESPLFIALLGMGRAFVLYVRSLVPVSLSFFALKANPLDNFMWAVVALATVPFGLRVVGRRWQLLLLVLLFYGAALIVWPWSYERFVSPVTSMLLVVIAAGALHLFRNRTKRVQRIALVGLAAFFVVGSVQAGLPTLTAMLSCDRSRPLESPTCYTEDRRGLLQLAAYVRDSTPPDALFFISKEAAFYLHSGRRSVRGTNYARLPSDSLGPVLRRRGVTFTAVTPIGANARRHNMAIAGACREFEKVASFDGDAVLLRLRATPIDHDDETCQLIAEWKNGIPARWLE